MAERIIPLGAQHERTALSWQRTILGTILGTAVLTMGAVRAGVTAVVGLGGVLILLLAVAFVLVSPARALRAGQHRSPWPDLLRISVSVACLGLLGAAAALTQALGA